MHEQRIKNLEAATAVRSSSGGGGVTPSTNSGGSFVYRPGGTAGGNVYTTDVTLLAALAALPGAKTVWVDDSIVSPAVLNQANMNLDGVEFTGVANYHSAQGGAALEFGASASASWSTLSFRGALLVTFVGTTAPLFSIATADTEANLFLDQGCSLVCGEQPFVNVESSTGFIFVYTISSYIGDGTHTVFSANGASSGLGVVQVAAQSTMEANAASGGLFIRSDPGSHVVLPQGVNTTVTEIINYPFGTTAQRPVGAAVGYMYFDSSLNAPIWETSVASVWKGAPNGAVKSTDQSVTSSTVLVNETAMSVSMSATAKVTVTWTLYVTMAAAAGIQLAVVTPTGATLLGMVTAVGIGATVGSDGEVLVTSGTGVNVLDNAAFGTSGVVTITATVIGDSTHAGNITLQFAQTTSSATSTTIKAGSSMTSFQAAA